MRLYGNRALLLWFATAIASTAPINGFSPISVVLAPPSRSAASGSSSTASSSVWILSATPPSSSSSSSSSSSDSINNWTPPPHWKFVGFRKLSSIGTISTPAGASSSALQSMPPDGAIMPDGGLNPCVIKVIGVGGGGCNAVDRMLDTDVGGVQFWSLNTDAQALGRSKAKGAKVLNIGAAATRGLGAGGNPEIGRMAAEESRKEIEQMVLGTDLCFVTAGMGGGTGSGAAAVVAEVAKESGCLTVGIVTKPFVFEGKRRMKQARAAIERLRQHVDTVIVVSNDRLLEIIPEDTPMERAFAVADDILRQGVVGISDIIVKPGLINVDFADVRSVMSNAGTALMGIGIGSGKTAAEDAAAAAISSPLLDATIDNAKGVVFNISGGDNLSLNEVNRAARTIYSTVEPDANVIFGALTDESLGDSISITVLATGFATSDDPEESTASAAVRPKTNDASPRSRAAPPPPARGPAQPAPRRQAQAQPPARQPAYQEPPSRRRSAPPPPPQQQYEEEEEDDDNIPDFLRGLKKKRR